MIDIWREGLYGFPTSSTPLLPDLVASGSVLALVIGPTPLQSEQTPLS